jgi:hypothetical protein
VKTVPDWAIGCMERAYIRLDGGEKDASVAIWIQTASQYFDLRIPHDRPALRGRRSLEDCSREELLALARQSGDTGVCTIEHRVATWKSWGDRFGFFCDDVAIFPDDGRLDPRGSVIYEYETEKSPVRYEEAWVQQPWDHGLVAHLTLRDERSPDEPLAVLLVAGRYAGYLERSTGESGESLEAQLARARGDLARARTILACEASYAVRPGTNAPYVVRHSNLPFREGRKLDVPRMSRRVLERTRSLTAERRGARWQVESWFIGR